MKIYNGGIKDWKKQGQELVSLDPLPEVPVRVITAEQLFATLVSLNGNCQANTPSPALTLLDLRNEVLLNPDSPPPSIKTQCPTVNLTLDDLLDAAILEGLPRQGRMVTITETGNRDQFAIRHLSKFGFNNVAGLKFGMRDWIKSGYPIAYRSGSTLGTNN